MSKFSKRMFEGRIGSEISRKTAHSTILLCKSLVVINVSLSRSETNIAIAIGYSHRVYCPTHSLRVWYGVEGKSSSLGGSWQQADTVRVQTG
uniref:SFRICE_015157 n=1 Tax=Spodoptera frugiperda TaxID=7108 RepID=A0A2H1V0C8_SPOFR